MRILFCTDGSEISLNAFHNVSGLIKNAIVDPICIIDWSFLPEAMSIDHLEYTKAYENIAESVLNFAQKVIEGRGYTLGNKIESVGSAAEGILEQIDKENYDLIVMGSHGKKGIQKWLGSVSRQVIANTLIPVFISKKKTSNNKILLATDGSEHSSNAIKLLIKNFDIKEKENFVISIKESPEFLPMEASMDKNWLDAIEKQQTIHATKAINKVKMLLEDAKIKVAKEIILTGNPAQKIIDFADKEKIDLVVMGARTKTDLSKLLLGSVSKRVLENVNCDVLIINK